MMTTDEQEQILRLQQDISTLMASVENLKRHQNLEEQLKAELRRTHREKTEFLDRAAFLEKRAGHLEFMAQQLQQETVHRAEMVNWRRADRRGKLAIIVGILFAIVITLGVVVLHIHDDDTLHTQQQQTKQSLCALLLAASQLHSTPQSQQLAAEANKLVGIYGCPNG